MLRNQLKLFALGLIALIACVLLRLLLDPQLGDEFPLVSLYGAVAAAVWLGGFRQALLIAILGYMASRYLFIAPRGSFDLSDVSTGVGLIVYLFTCSLIILFGEIARTAQIRAKERLDVLRVTLQSIGDAVITTNIEGRITTLNKEAESLTGWPNHEALGQPLDKVFRIVNEVTRQPVENPATRALRDGVVVGLANHTVLIRRDGKEFPVDDSTAPIRNENRLVSGCVLIFRDVTAQRLIERERTSQLLTARLLASIVESSNDAIISKSLDGVIQSWNVAAEHLFGFTSEEAVGRHITLVIPPERIAEEDQIIASLKAGRRIEHFQTERLRKDGRRIIVSLTISPIRDDSGNVVGASKIVRDLTDLQKLAASLSDADRRKNEFLATLAHELRNPLAPMSNMLEVLKRADSDGKIIKLAHETIERQLAQIVRLVDDLLDLSRITHDRLELRRSEVDLASVIHQAVEAAQPLIDASDHRLTLKLPDEPVYLNADRARLAQVFSNLLNNSSKYTKRNGTLSLTAERHNDEVVVRVTDNGAGIPANKLHSIFDMFMQVDQGSEGSHGGLGIGLTLVKRLTEMHGGSIEAKSAGTGLGSEFIVRLPVIHRSPATTPAPAINPQSSPQRRILVVDDNRDSAESLALLLKMTGNTTYMAHDGIEAVEAIDRYRPEVVLLDIGLPGMSGHEVCRRIREQPWGKDIVVIALTGWGQEDDRRKSKEAGFNGHLVKPVDYNKLLELLRD